MASNTYVPGKLSGAVNNLGSENAVLAECNSSGSIIGTWAQFGIIKDSTLTDNTEQVTLTSEAGRQYKRNGSRNVEFTMTIMQTDTTTMTAVNLMRDKYFTIVKEHAETEINSDYIYIVMPICKYVPEATIKQPGGENAYKFSLEAPTTTVTVSLTNAATGGTFSSTLTGNSVFSSGTYWQTATI